MGKHLVQKAGDRVALRTGTPARHLHRFAEQLIAQRLFLVNVEVFGGPPRPGWG